MTADDIRPYLVLETTNPDTGEITTTGDNPLPTWQKERLVCTNTLSIVRNDSGAVIGEVAEEYVPDVPGPRCPSGLFVAVFPTADRASRFWERITNAPGDFYTSHARRNRANGRIVSWIVPADQQLSDSLGQPTDRATGLRRYWLDMCDTVGSYGSDTLGPKHATLNGRYCRGEW